MPRYIWIDNEITRRATIGRFLLDRRVLEEVGTDHDFIQHIRTLPSCISGVHGEYTESGDERCVAAHVRRASTAGTGLKPPYSCVPLRQKEEHLLQHSSGETALRPKFWWDEQRERYVEEWAITVLKRLLRLTGEQNLDMRLLSEWAAEKGIEKEFWDNVR